MDQLEDDVGVFVVGEGLGAGSDDFFQVCQSEGESGGCPQSEHLPKRPGKRGVGVRCFGSVLLRELLRLLLFAEDLGCFG